ncbi:hypothetical protein BGW38_000990 [Lunasporangiospora selenospora]|uniref:Regulator of chromosome condensation (RCC1) repeat-containing protein n=1 Tax=Lunasporangiospora selenospora TaxID=979761 RepID=A0A9P6KIW7_9FUNG|nr:hypothetical protein BGW38_000990 [Lunasporangiospora selenospora]
MGTNPGYARDIAQGSDQALRDPVLRSSTYASTLSRSVSARASTTPSRQNLRPIFSRQAQHTPFQHQSEPQCEKPSVQRGSSPYADTRSSRADNLGSQQQRLASLFQQARSQTISRQSVSRSPSTSDHVERPRPPAQNKTTRSPANHRSQTRQTLPYARNECSEESNRHPPSLKPDSTVKVILPNPHTDYVQGSTIEERIRFIRAKAEETRLELLALEQLELDMCQQAGQEAGVIGQSVSTKDITLSISTLPIRHGTKSGSTTRSGTSRHSPRTPSPLSMSFAPDAVTRKGPTPDRSSSDSFNSIDQKNKPRHSGYIVEVDPLSSSPPDPDSSSPPVSPLEYEDLSTSCSSLESGNQNRKTLISTARRVPITQAQPNIALVAALRRPVDTVGRLHGWVPTPKRQAEVTSSNSADDDDDEEILDSYLSEYQEDLRDTTISDMMRQHLFLLSDSDENSEGKETHSAGSPFDSAKTVNTITGESLLPEADLTFADRTGYFMSMLEQDYDQQAGLSSGSSIESVPMLLSETLPEVQDDADSSFIGQSSAGTQSPQKTIMERNASSSSSPHLQRELLNSTSFSKGSILEEFLKSNPRISKLGSPLDRPEPLVLPPPTQQQQAHSRQRPVQTLPPPGPTFNPTPSRILNCTSSSTQSWANRVKPLPTPIITSHEYCRQVTQRRSGHCSESQRPALPHLSSQAVANEVNSTKRQLSPLISRPLTSPTSPWSGFQTPLISKAPDSSDVTAIESGGISDSASSESQPTTPLSVYNSAKEEFPVGSMLFHDDDLNIPGSQDSKKPTAPSHGLNITTAPAAPAAPTSASFDKVVPAQKEVPKSTAKSQNRQPLDMIIVRPSMIPEVCATPEDPVSSVGSGTSTSSWTWSWPSSATSACRLSTSSTTTASDGEEETLITHGQMNASGEPQRLHPQGIKIKSRSMSSLVKHQNGWLGFMALDVRLAASGRNHIVVATHSNQIYTCWEHHDNDMNNDGPGHDNKNPVDTTRGKGPKRKNGPEKLAIELILGRMTMTDNGAGFIQDTTLQPGLVQIDGKMFVLESKVTKIVCSDWATFLLTEHGNLWGWGYFEDKHGHRISLVNKSGSQVGPIKICPQRIIDVACGNNHVLILNASKDVISWGANDRGQLGRPKQQASQVSHVNSTSPPPSDRSLDIEDDMDQSPYFIEGLPPNIIGIGSGKNFSFAWDEERLYGWGDNSSAEGLWERSGSSSIL